ncbi:MAG TPA: MgtC/SapB family protein [Levilinea sp.]|nr:MgtC/SapB family protein [Levilinea sp.]
MDLDLASIFPDVVKLVLAIVVGGLIGLEREILDKDAGFRTLTLICVGSTLFTIFSISVSPAGDGGRIAAQIVSGVGFLGAGVILREGTQVRGLTTASTVWLVAALGMGIGMGNYLFSVSATAILLLVLFVFPKIEKGVDALSETRTYHVTVIDDQNKLGHIHDYLLENHLRIRRNKQSRNGACIISTWETYGRSKNHDQVVGLMLSDPDIEEFHY